MPDLVAEIRTRIAEAADPRRAPQMQAYLKSDLPFRGVYSGPLRALLRETIPAHPLPDRHSWQAAVLALWDGAGYGEERYAALTLARHRLYRAHQDPQTLVLYRHLVVTGAWWDTVDQLASHHVGDILRSHPAAVTPLMRAWAVEEDLWLRRTAILCQLGSKDRTDTDLLAHALRHNLAGSEHGHEFFIRKACGWALRQHARTDARWVLDFVAAHEHELSGLTRREALKHLG